MAKYNVLSIRIRGDQMTELRAAQRREGRPISNIVRDRLFGLSPLITACRVSIRSRDILANWYISNSNHNN